MASQFTLPTIFRHISNDLVKRYFEETAKAPLDVDWSSITQTGVQPIFEAWKKLDDKTRETTARDLYDVFSLGTDAGTRSLLTLSSDTDSPLQQTFADMDNPYDRAMWVLIERPNIWKSIQAFFPVDQLINKRYWRRYRDLPKGSISKPEEKADQLANAISQMFWQNEGHGQKRKAEYHAKGEEADYFSIFIDDLATREMRLNEENEFTSDPRPRVDEMAFIWHPKEGVARVYVERDAKTARTLFEVFYRVMFKKEPPRDDVRQSAYRLNRLLEPDFRFAWDGHDGVRSVAVKRMRLSLKTDRARRITLEGNVEERGDRDTIQMMHRFLDKRQLPLELLDVDQVTLTFDLEPGRYGRRKSLTFDVNWPNGGNLHNQAEELQPLGQKCLERWCIDVKPCENEEGLLSVLRLADDGDSLIDDELCEQWPNGLKETLLAQEILVQAEASKQVRCWACNEIHPVTPEAIGETEGVRYRMACPVAGDVPIIDERRLDRWRIDVHALIKWVRTVLRLASQPNPVVDGQVWRLGTSTFSGVNGTIYFARQMGSLSIDERAHPFEPNAIVIVPDQRAESPILTRHNVRVFKLSDLLVYGTDGLEASLDGVFKQLGVTLGGDQAQVELEPWRFQRSDQFTIHGQSFTCELTMPQQRFVELASGKLTVPLSIFFQKNGSGHWKERLSGGNGTKKQRSKVTTLTNRLNERLMNAGIGMSFDLPRDSYDIHVRLPEVTAK